ncbi:MAG: hypothetical protein ACKOX3_09990 [Bacteroidota bacterium]
MIRVLSRIEIDNLKWNNCISNSDSPQLFGYTFFLDICCPEWIGIVLNDYEAVFPISLKSKFHIRYLSQPYFVRHFGIYATNHFIDFKLWIPHLLELATYFNFDVFNINSEFSNHFNVTEKVYQTLDLNFTHSALKSNYSNSHLRKIKKVANAEVQLQDITNYAVFAEEFRHTVSNKNLNYSDKHISTLQQLMQEIPKHCNVISKGVYFKNELLAAAYFVQINNRILYLKGFRKSNTELDGVMFYLFDSIIKEHCNQSILLDFGGANDKNVRQFFRGFGAKDSVYLHLEKNNLPRPLRWLKK